MGLKIPAKKTFLVPFVLFLSIFIISVPAQQKTNLEIFYNLVDSSIAKINQKISTTDIKISFATGSYFDVFQNQVISDFEKLNRKILSEKNNNSSEVTKVNYIIVNAKVKYGEMERDGFLGDFIMPRKIELSGSYSINNKTIKAESFREINIDTVAVDDVRAIEDPAYSFTRGNVPPEPFLSSLLEPVIAISSAAVAVILFFTVRSK